MREKETWLQVRINKETKKEFFKVCEERAINPSALVRKWIEEFLQEKKN